MTMPETNLSDFPPAFLDEIRNHVPISDVIGPHVSWDPRKTNRVRGDWWACCPFHGEKSPSFHCEDKKARYHCFGCGVSGDHFRFLTEMNGLSFREAVERVAGMAGLAMPDAPRRVKLGSERQSPAKTVTLTDRSGAKSRKVFIVHGRTKSHLNEVELFLRRLRLEPLVLHQQPNGGRTLITKFQDVAKGAGFAVVILAPEDEGRLQGEAVLEHRARQNVVFELGFFIGRLGEGNVCALVPPGVQKPSDFDGVAYVPFGESTNWERELARELRHAGIPFDPADVF